MTIDTISNQAQGVAECPTAERRSIKRSEVIYALTVLVIGILFFATAV